MNKSNLAFYSNLIKDYLDGEMTVLVFERVFPYVFTRDNDLSDKEYETLNPLFWGIENFVDDPNLRDEGDINEIQLKEIAKGTFKKLAFFLHLKDC